MNEVRAISTSLIVPVGTQVVLRAGKPKSGSTDDYPKGTIAEIIQPPEDGHHSYRVRCADGGELSLRRQEFSILKQVKLDPLGDPAQAYGQRDLREYIVYECVVGSRAYGLDHEGSDTDRRGVYLPPADLEWSLYGVPEQLEYRDSEECYWELQKFLALALKANPNILECLFTPLVVRTSEVGDALLEKRTIFLSKLVYQTYNGYVMSLTKRTEERLESLAKYREAYRHYCWPVESIEDLKLAPFHLLATEGLVHTDKQHGWHMEKLAKLCAQDEKLLLATPFKIVDVNDTASCDQAAEWWQALTSAGGEGMVVKPLDFICKGRRGHAQPAVKCRGPEYLRIIYGPEYLMPENLERLRSRGLGAKHSLASREFALGVEALERFVRKETLRRTHECVFGVLALESEPVDPRL